MAIQPATIVLAHNVLYAGLIFSIVSVCVVSVVVGRFKFTAIPFALMAVVLLFMSSVVLQLLPKEDLRREQAGKLLTITVNSGIFHNQSLIETTTGFFNTVGSASGEKGSPVWLVGVDQRHKEEKLCLGDEATFCYRLIASN